MSQQVSPPGESKQLGAGSIASIGGAVLLLIVILQNRESVTFNFLFWDFTWPLWLYTVVVAVFGAFVWVGVGVIRRRRRRQERRDDR
jgi:uncharacterized integral membrane protein